MIIIDEFIGTPIKKFENGCAIVELKPDCNTEFVTINKLVDGSKTAKDENVEVHCNFIFEIDNEDLKNQKKRAIKLFNDGIINRVVYSGSKSLHCRITIEDMPENKEEYKFIWKKLNELYFESKADRACSNPARLTRMPNANRSNGVKQERIFLSNTILKFEWRKEYEFEKMIDNYLLKQDYNNENQSNKTPVETLLKRNIPDEARKLLENNFIDGERHRDIPKAIAFLKKCGFELPELERLVWQTKIKDNINYVKNLYQYFN